MRKLVCIHKNDNNNYDFIIIPIPIIIVVYECIYCLQVFYDFITKYTDIFC